MNPLVSIIMPAYNAEKYIEYSINSVIEQSYKEWELLIVDDGSKDKTKEIIKVYSELDNRIKPLYSKTNSGRPSIAKNKLFEYVNGDYIAFLDSDDLWLKTKLEKQVDAMENNRKYGLCYTGGFFINENNQKISSFLPKYKNGNVFSKMLRKYEINNQSVLIRKELFKKFNENIIIGEDYNLFMNIVFKNNAYVFKEKLIKYRIHSNSITKSKTKDISDGVIFTLKELNKKYKIAYKYPLSYSVCLINAYRNKILNYLGLK